MNNMTTQSCCQFCEGHCEEWETARSTMSILRSKVEERSIYGRMKQSIERDVFHCNCEHL